MNCQNCGQPMPNDARFCSNCGAFVDSSGIQTPEPIQEGFEGLSSTVAENPQIPSLHSAPPPSFQPAENNQFYPQPPSGGAPFPYQEQPLQQAGFVMAPQQPQPANKKNSMIWLLIVGVALVILLVGALSVFIVGNLSSSSQKLDRDTNVLMLKDTRGRYYTVHSDGTADQLDIPKDSVYFLNNYDGLSYAMSSMGSSEDFSKKLFFSSDYRKYYTSNNPKDIVSDMILLDKKTVSVLEGATYCYGSSSLDTIYYVSTSGKSTTLSVYYTKTGQSVELDSSRNLENLSQYASACSFDGKVFVYVLGNPDSSKDTTAYKIVNGGEPAEIGKNIYPVAISNDQKNFIYYELDSRGSGKLFHESGSEKITIASRIDSSDLDYLITNGKTNELIYKDNGKFYYYTTNEKPVYIFDDVTLILAQDTFHRFLSQTTFNNDSLKELVYVDILGENFYFFDKEDNVETFNCKDQVLFSNDTIYYTNSSDTLYKLNLITGEEERIARSVFFFSISNQSDTVIYSTNKNSVHAIVNGKETDWSDYSAQWCDVSDDGKYLYFVDANEEELYLSVGGAEPTLIDETGLSFASVIGNKLFYVDDNGKLFMYNPKTDEITEVINRVDMITPTFPIDFFKNISINMFSN